MTKVVAFGVDRRAQIPAAGMKWNQQGWQDRQGAERRKSRAAGRHSSSGLGCWVDSGATFCTGSTKGRTCIGGRRERLLLVIEVEVSKGLPRWHSKLIHVSLVGTLTLGCFHSSTL